MPRLYIVDSFNLIFRAYHARQRSGQPPMRTSRGASTEAVYIFHNMIRRLKRQFSPDLLAAAFESEGPTFRDQLFPQYKATRAETPPELLEQIPIVERMLNALRIPVLQLPGYEADDLIGALSRIASEAGCETVIVSSDKDMLQLVGGRVSMLDMMKNDTLYDPAKVKEAKGVPPALIPDLLALIGDTADNIPGAPGVGEKGAVQILEQFGSVEAALDRCSEIKRKAYADSLRSHRAQILLSKRLATIDRHAPLAISLPALAVREPDLPALAALYRELEFFSFLKELNAGSTAEPSAQSPAAPPAPDTLIVYDWKSRLRSDPALNPGKPVEDILLYAFLVLADPSACQLESLIARYLERVPASEEETLQALAEKLRPLLTPELRKLYDEIDLPLAPVLARMERAGIRIETAHLETLARRMDEEINSLASEIYAIAGHPFNINSPQQLGKVLFEELHIPAQGRTGKTKNYSTAADVLESLAESWPIARKVLDYRQLAKLKGTYVDALPQLIDPATGRLHTTFNPAGAATGRLSSSNPNLQNIPIRTELGREIRAAFVPEPGWTLLAADYSQIELRLLAHYSKDPVLTDAFRKNEDIHTRTASEVFGVPPLMVTPEMRRNAKAVNFGIVYGQTSFGLAAQLGIPRDEADSYIRSYFTRYAGVKQWIDRTIGEVRSSGFTTTLYGRRRPIPDINSKNPNARSFAERTAVNTPLQGTAADLIKIAMIAIDRELLARGMKTRMLLQVHDELVLECPPGELRAASALVRNLMESAARLDVPLLAETGTGPNWRDAK
jgi:DNA polymerase-1